jgi:hypothetical protein
MFLIFFDCVAIGDAQESSLHRDYDSLIEGLVLAGVCSLGVLCLAGLLAMVVLSS